MDPCRRRAGARQESRSYAVGVSAYLRATQGDPVAEPMEALAKQFDLFTIPGTGRIGLLDADQNMVEQLFGKIIRARHADEDSRWPAVRLSRSCSEEWYA